MDTPLCDIVVTVWNRQIETRNCLVHLMEHSPDYRLVIVDNGSDRETERMLEEFAEQLDQRAVLMRNDVNQGYVRGVNMGLERAEARFIVVVRNTVLVTPSWLAPLSTLAADRDDVGIVVPRHIKAAAKGGLAKKSPPLPPCETDHGSMDAMLITRKAYCASGGIDIDMDGGVWALRDLSRRFLQKGFATFRVDDSAVFFQEDTPMGSAERRHQALQRSISLYASRWGERSAFCLYFPKEAEIDVVVKRLQIILHGARQGHLFTILLHGVHHREIALKGLDRQHDSIVFRRLPMFFESRTIAAALERDGGEISSVQPVAGIDGVQFPGGAGALSFEQLERFISGNSKEFYGSR